MNLIIRIVTAVTVAWGAVFTGWLIYSGLSLGNG